jgi:cobalt-zinc-cadmium efflux system membrane fusion protein
MARQPLRAFLGQLKKVVGPKAAGGLTDAQLLERFVGHGDEAAFEVLVWRHGALVLQVARRLLTHAEDAEDAFQATFLTLARKAGSVRRPAALGGWLYQVAYRVALRARAARRTTSSAPLAEVQAPPAIDPVWSDLRPVLDEEISRLPEKYRLPVVLCYLEGRTLDEAARQLGCPKGTVCSRLAGARERLRTRLTRRGLALTGAGLALLLGTKGDAATVPADLVKAAVREAVSFAAGKPAALLPATALAEGVLRTMWLTKLRIAAVVLLAVVVTGTGVGLFVEQVLAEKPDAAAGPTSVPGQPGALRLPADMLTRLGIQSSEVRPRAASVRRLELAGVLAIDPDRMVHVGSRFAGEVVEVGGVALPRAGDRVKKDQLLAVIWSKDVGQKKSELLEALLQERLDKAVLDRLDKLFQQGTIPEATVHAATRTYEADRTAVNRAERTLRTWRVHDAEIQAVVAEAERVAGLNGKRDRDREKEWARVEIRAPLDGTLLEKNVARGDVVDDRTALFKIADLRQLAVLANAAEADVPALRALTPEQRQLTVRLLADPETAPVDGKIEQLGTTVDPNTGTFAIRGSVPNPDGQLLPGQSVRVTIPLPGTTREVSVPASAVVEDGKDSVVLVQPDPAKFEYVARRVLVVRRGRDVVHVRSPLTTAEQRQGFEPLRAGERIVTAGAVELRGLWADLKERPRP